MAAWMDGLTDRPVFFVGFFFCWGSPRLCKINITRKLSFT